MKKIFALFIFCLFTKMISAQTKSGLQYPRDSVCYIRYQFKPDTNRNKLTLNFTDYPRQTGTRFNQETRLIIEGINPLLYKVTIDG